MPDVFVRESSQCRVQPAFDASFRRGLKTRSARPLRHFDKACKALLINNLSHSVTTSSRLGSCTPAGASEPAIAGRRSCSAKIRDGRASRSCRTRRSSIMGLFDVPLAVLVASPVLLVLSSH